MVNSCMDPVSIRHSMFCELLDSESAMFILFNRYWSDLRLFLRIFRFSSTGFSRKSDDFLVGVRGSFIGEDFF